MKLLDAAWPVLAVLTLLVALPAATLVSDQPPTLPEVMARAAVRVAPLADATRVVTGEERYAQKLQHIRAVVGFDYSGPVGSRSEVTADGVNARQWVAELALLGTPGNEAAGFPWMELRDIVSVNGKPVRDGTSRLKVLQADASAAAGLSAVETSREAANFMFGRLVRAVDVPRAAILLLHSSNQPRFEFKKAGERTIDGVRTWEVKFREKVTPSIIRASGGRESVSSGSFWIDPATGHVMMSLLKSPDSSTVYVEQTVTYREAPGTGLWLPAEMKERVIDDDAALRVEATAAFSSWRVVTRGQPLPRQP